MELPTTISDMDPDSILTFSVQGSAAQPYQVKFERLGERVIASCTCPAGTFRELCKHRIMIMNGLTKGIVSENLHLVSQVSSWISGSEIATALAEMTLIESQIEQLKKQLVKVKKTIGQVMT